jgi:hypothetical protein
MNSSWSARNDLVIRHGRISGCASNTMNSFPSQYNTEQLHVGRVFVSGCSSLQKHALVQHTQCTNIGATEQLPPPHVFAIHDTLYPPKRGVGHGYGCPPTAVGSIHTNIKPRTITSPACDGAKNRPVIRTLALVCLLRGRLLGDRPAVAPTAGGVLPAPWLIGWATKTNDRGKC